MWMGSKRTRRSNGEKIRRKRKLLNSAENSSFCRGIYGPVGEQKKRIGSKAGIGVIVCDGVTLHNVDGSFENSKIEVERTGDYRCY